MDRTMEERKQKMDSPILEVKDLHFTYNDEKHALNGVDLKIYEGEKSRFWVQTERESRHFF